MESKAIVLSDTHGDIRSSLEVIEKHNDINTIFHLGDLTNDVERIKINCPNKEIYFVSGNNDFNRNIPYEQLVSFGGKKIFITHGHRQNVNSNYFNIALLAREKSADAVLFGHTHSVFNDNYMGVVLFNPGSISLPRGTTDRTYGILTVTDLGSIVCEVKKYNK